MRRNGFTLIELLVVVAVLALLAAILLPVFARARYQSYKVVCTAHQRQLAVALRAYGDDYEGVYPPLIYVGEPVLPRWDGPPLSTRTVYGLIAPYVKGDLWRCPAEPLEPHLQAIEYWTRYPLGEPDRLLHYTPNTCLMPQLMGFPGARFVNESEIVYPSETPLISDSYLIPRKQAPLVLSGLISGRHLESPASLHPGPSRDNRLNTILMTATDLHARTIFVRLRPDGEERTYPQRPMLLDGTRVPVWLVDTGPFRAYPFLDGVPRDDPRIPGRLEVRCPARGVYGG